MRWCESRLRGCVARVTSKLSLMSVKMGSKGFRHRTWYTWDSLIIDYFNLDWRGSFDEERHFLEMIPPSGELHISNGRNASVTAYNRSNKGRCCTSVISIWTPRLVVGLPPKPLVRLPFKKWIFSCRKLDGRKVITLCCPYTAQVYDIPFGKRGIPTLVPTQLTWTKNKRSSLEIYLKVAARHYTTHSFFGNIIILQN